MLRNGLRAGLLLFFWSWCVATKSSSSFLRRQSSTVKFSSDSQRRRAMVSQTYNCNMDSIQAFERTATDYFYFLQHYYERLDVCFGSSVEIMSSTGSSSSEDNGPQLERYKEIQLLERRKEGYLGKLRNILIDNGSTIYDYYCLVEFNMVGRLHSAKRNRQWARVAALNGALFIVKKYRKLILEACLSTSYRLSTFGGQHFLSTS